MHVLTLREQMIIVNENILEYRHNNKIVDSGAPIPMLVSVFVPI